MEFSSVGNLSKQVEEYAKQNKDYPKSIVFSWVPLAMVRYISFKNDAHIGYDKNEAKGRSVFFHE